MVGQVSAIGCEAGNDTVVPGISVSRPSTSVSFPARRSVAKPRKGNPSLRLRRMHCIAAAPYRCSPPELGLFRQKCADLASVRCTPAERMRPMPDRAALQHPPRLAAVNTARKQENRLLQCNIAAAPVGRPGPRRVNPSPAPAGRDSGDSLRARDAPILVLSLCSQSLFLSNCVARLVWGPFLKFVGFIIRA
jgi:hypothetical protein